MAEQNQTEGTPVVVPAEPGEQNPEINPELLALAMGFVPVQVWQNIYNNDTALARGTIFADLDKPFIGEEAVQNDRT